jgi:hypothetical protein
MTDIARICHGIRSAHPNPTPTFPVETAGLGVATLKRLRPDDWLELVRLECGIGRSPAMSFWRLAKDA